MEPTQTTPTVINGYDPKSPMRTFFGVAASLLSMGLPVGLTELLRAGGDIKVAMWGGLATAAAVICAILSIRGTLKE